MEADRLLQVVAEALERAPTERAAYLHETCKGDAELLAEARSLIDHDDAGADAFLETPAFAIESVAGELEAGGELQPGDVLGDCRIIRLLGEGGMGEVYLARDIGLERDVAVKVLKRQFSDETIRRRFRHERKILAGLTHPNIARLYGGAITPEGRPYLAMEYVEGEPLDRYCDEKRLGVAARLEIFRQVCGAVTHAHQNLIVHRDLKPANIRVTAAGEPKLLDFGIAKLLDENEPERRDLTVTMFAALTPEYASPEQLEHQPITTASDVYSLGVVLYEMLAGRRPFTVKQYTRPDELARAIREEEPARLRTVAAALSGDLENIAAMALRKEPERRYASVAQLSEDIRRYLAGLPVAARRDTLRYRTEKFVRRNKAGVAAGALALLALVGALAATTWQGRVARQERDRAQLAQKQALRVSEFLQDLLGSADPAKMGKDVKVLQVLDVAAAKLDHELTDEPEVLAQAHQTLSRAYSRLHVVEPAEAHARAALAIIQRLHGEDDSETADAETLLGLTLNSRYRFEESLPLFRKALAIQKRQPAQDDLAIARILDGMGDSLTITGHPREAEAVVQEAVERMRAARGERSSDYINALLGLGIIKNAANDVNGAADIFRRVIALYDQLSPGTPLAYSAEIDLCICLFAQHRFDELGKLLTRMERESREAFGEKSLYYALAVYGRGCLDFALGDYAGAAAIMPQVLGPMRGAFPPDQINVIQCQTVLGLSLTRLGHATDGEPFIRTAYADGKNTDKAQFANTFGNLDEALGECLLAQNRFTEAEPLLVSGLAELKTRPIVDPAIVQAAERRLANLHAQGTHL